MLLLYVAAVDGVMCGSTHMIFAIANPTSINIKIRDRLSNSRILNFAKEGGVKKSLAPTKPTRPTICVNPSDLCVSKIVGESHKYLNS